MPPDFIALADRLHTQPANDALVCRCVYASQANWLAFRTAVGNILLYGVGDGVGVDNGVDIEVGNGVDVDNGVGIGVGIGVGVDIGVDIGVGIGVGDRVGVDHEFLVVLKRIIAVN